MGDYGTPTTDPSTGDTGGFPFIQLAHLALRQVILVDDGDEGQDSLYSGRLASRKIAMYLVVMLATSIFMEYLVLAEDGRRVTLKLQYDLHSK